MLIVKLSILQGVQFCPQLISFIKGSSVTNLFPNFGQTFKAHHYEVEAAAPSELFENPPSYSQSINAAHITICNHVLILLPSAFLLLPYMLQLLRQILLLVFELFLLYRYIWRVEYDDVRLCWSFSQSKGKAIEERSVDLSDV